LQLTAVGVSPDNINFRAVTAESEKFITVREQAAAGAPAGGAQNTVVIIDMTSPLNPTRRQISADSALMCLDKKVIALKASAVGTVGDNLQVFNLDSKTKLKAHQMPEPVEFWKWISPTMLGLVTATSVYHWDIEVGEHGLAASGGQVAAQLPHS
jgi:clathrin heavy chain